MTVAVLILNVALPMAWALVAPLLLAKGVPAVDDSLAPLLPVLLGTLVPLALTLGHWGTCGAKNSTNDWYCHRRRSGLFSRCHHHDGFAWSDLFGLTWGFAFVMVTLHVFG